MLSHTHSPPLLKSFSSSQKKQKLPMTPLWTCSPCQMEDNSCAQWNIKRFASSNQNKMIIVITNEIGGLILFPTFYILMGSLSSIIANSLCLISTSFFVILLLHPNYFKVINSYDNLLVVISKHIWIPIWLNKLNSISNIPMFYLFI